MLPTTISRYFCARQEDLFSRYICTSFPIKLKNLRHSQRPGGSHLGRSQILSYDPGNEVKGYSRHKPLGTARAQPWIGYKY